MRKKEMSEHPAIIILRDYVAAHKRRSTSKFNEPELLEKAEQYLKTKKEMPKDSND